MNRSVVHFCGAFPMIVLLAALLMTACSRSHAPAAVSDEEVGEEAVPLFEEDLTNASYPPGSWTFKAGVLSASEDVEIWTRDTFSDFELELEFVTRPGANSGVIIHADTSDWVPNSLEIQIADDHHEMWATAPATWKAGAVFGHLAPDSSAVFPPGMWNRMIIRSRDRTVSVELNGVPVTEMKMDRWTSATVNPDGSEIPEWLSRPVADLPARGHIGLQGAHGETPVSFRNLRIRRLD